MRCESMLPPEATAAIEAMRPTAVTRCLREALTTGDSGGGGGSALAEFRRRLVQADKEAGGCKLTAVHFFNHTGKPRGRRDIAKVFVLLDRERRMLDDLTEVAVKAAVRDCVRSIKSPAKTVASVANHVRAELSSAPVVGGAFPAHSRRRRRQRSRRESRRRRRVAAGRF